MLEVLYEDRDIIVVKKPVGVESQSSASFAPDMVSEIRKHIQSLSTIRGNVCGSYPQTGQACRRRHGVCQDQEHGRSPL